MGNADVWPFMITVQYYPFPAAAISPYVGFGVNYSFINNENFNGSTATQLGIDRTEAIDAKNSFGSVFQFGVDIPVNDKWMINCSTTFLELKLDASGYIYSSGTGTEISANMRLKKVPNITTVGITYLF